MDEPADTKRVRWALDLARCASDVANFCDHAEHNEVTDRSWVLDSARTMRRLACEIAAELNDDLRERYAARLRAVEHRNPLWSPGAPDGEASVLQARTWQEFQLVQADHDRFYHPDVLGLSKLAQLHHYALHVSKLSGALAAHAQDEIAVEDFSERRVPDLLLFGIKLSTVLGQRLPETALAEPVDERVLIVA